MKKKNEKLLIIDSSVENCDIVVSTCEGDLFEIVKNDVEQYEMSAEPVNKIIEKMIASGSYVDPEDEAGDPCLIYSKGKSPFGTDMITLKYWSPEDILSRFTIVYMILPEGMDNVNASERALMRGAYEAAVRFLSNDPGEDEDGDAIDIQTAGRIYSAAKEFIDAVEAAGYSF